MSKQPKVFIEGSKSFPNERHYHLNRPVLGSKSRFVYLLDNDLPEWLSEPVKRLANRLEGIEGIEILKLERHSVEVWKADAYEWDEIEPLVLDAICAYLVQRSIAIVRRHSADTASTTPEGAKDSFEELAV